MLILALPEKAEDRAVGLPMIDKILAAHAGLDRVEVGDIVVCEVDLAVQIDLVFAMTGDQMIPKRIADPERVALIFDHTVPAPTIADATGHSRAREFARRFGITKVFDVGDHGICHQVILERGLALPGQILTCTDSHTIASGALNCAARGLGPVEMLQIVCTGRTWFKVSPTIRVELTGTKPSDVFGKDVFLYLAGVLGSVEGHNLEFGGPGLSSLGLDDRSTLATMCAEISANFAIMPADQLVLDHLTRVTQAPLDPVEPDADACYSDAITVELSGVRPQVARPHSVPGNTIAVAELGEVPIHQAFIGSCANGKLEDLRTAAHIVKGHKVHPGVRLVVTPASQRVYLDAVRRGYVTALLEAGAVVTNSTCGACYGGHMGLLGPGETCVTSSTRNFRGRMGSSEAQIYIASSATVAASALAGHIVEPTSYLEEAGLL